MSDRDLKITELKKMSELEAEAYAIYPIYHGFNTSHAIRRIDALFRSGNKDAAKGAWTALKVMGFGSVSHPHVNHLKTDDELKQMVTGAISGLWYTYGIEGLNHPNVRENLENLGYEVFVQNDGSLNWSWMRRMFSGVLEHREPLKTIANLTQIEKMGAQND